MEASAAGLRHIVVEGPIGVGKTSLARRLAQALDAELVLELPDDNPFLARFYADRAGYAFQTQLAFLYQRARQMRALAQTGLFSRAVVSDFIFAKDELFARLTLSDDEYRLYSQMYAPLAREVVEPDLVIWLQASPPTLLQRIRTRALTMERDIDADYLQRLCDAYVDYFRSYAGAPVLAIDTEHFNPAQIDADFASLLERVAGLGGHSDLVGAPSADLA